MVTVALWASPGPGSGSGSVVHAEQNVQWWPNLANDLKPFLMMVFILAEVFNYFLNRFPNCSQPLGTLKGFHLQLLGRSNFITVFDLGSPWRWNITQSSYRGITKRRLYYVSCAFQGSWLHLHWDDPRSGCLSRNEGHPGSARADIPGESACRRNNRYLEGCRFPNRFASLLMSY